MTPDLGLILAKLGALVLLRRSTAGFVPIGRLPSWCPTLSPRPVHPNEEVNVTEVFPYFELFLEAAEEIWSGDGDGRLEVGEFAQILADGAELHLTGTALLVEGHAVLVVAENDRALSRERVILQRARELRIRYDALSREIEQHDVLTHCLVHDLRNPLSTVIAAVALLERQRLDERTTQLVEITRQAAQAQADLIADLLRTFAERKLTEAERERHRARVDAGAVVLEVATMTAPRARASGVTFDAVVPHTKSVEVFADALRLFRVIGNLVDNAMKYSAPGMTVRVAVHEERGLAVVVVDDEGPGVPPAFVPHLFEKLARADDGVPGTGLGLFFCRITVESWGGEIGYEPRAGRGARFWFRLPLVTSACEASSLTRTAPPHSGPNRTGSGGTG